MRLSLSFPFSKTFNACSNVCIAGLDANDNPTEWYGTIECIFTISAISDTSVKPLEMAYVRYFDEPFHGPKVCPSSGLKRLRWCQGLHSHDVVMASTLDHLVHIVPDYLRGQPDSFLLNSYAQYALTTAPGTSIFETLATLDTDVSDAESTHLPRHSASRTSHRAVVSMTLDPTLEDDVQRDPSGATMECDSSDDDGSSEDGDSISDCSDDTDSSCSQDNSSD